MTPRRGTLALPRLRTGAPSGAGLKYRRQIGRRSPLPPSGVSASYSFAWSRRVPVERQAPVLARREDRPGGRGVVALRCAASSGESTTHERRDRGHDERSGRRCTARMSTCRFGPTNYSPRPWTPSSRSPRRSSRCASSGDLLRRFRARRAPELAAWSAGARRLRAGGRSARLGRGAGLERSRVSRLLPRRRAAHGAPARRQARSSSSAAGGSLPSRSRTWASRSASLSRCRCAFSLSGDALPHAQDVLDLWPARILAIVGNSLGTLAVVAVALLTLRPRPLGNALILAGIAVAALGSALAGLGVGRARAGDRCRRGPALRRFRQPSRRFRRFRRLRRRGSSPPARSRSQTATKSATTASAIVPSAIAPGIPPCATTHAKAATARPRCRAPSAPAAGTASAGRRGDR